MSEESWGSDHTEPARARGGVPRWVWFCGGGCLLMGLLAVVALVVGGRIVSRMLDPDMQWERLAEALPYDERPDLPIGGLKVPFQPLRIWWLVDQGAGLQGVIFHAGGDVAQDMRSDLLEGGGEYTRGERGQVSSGEVEVQGRPLLVVRWTGGDAAQEEPGAEPAGEPAARDEGGGFFDSLGNVLEAQAQAANAVVDLSRPGEPDALLLMLTRQPGLGGSSAPTRPTTDEEIRAFLEPFHVGEQR